MGRGSWNTKALKFYWMWRVPDKTVVTKIGGVTSDSGYLFKMMCPFFQTYWGDFCSEFPWRFEVFFSYSIRIYLQKGCWKLTLKFVGMVNRM